MIDTDIQTALRPQKVAIVHDWIFTRRGGEQVLERILNLYPTADLYYLFGDPKKHLKLKYNPVCTPSFLNAIPFINKIYKYLLFLLPMAIESFDFSRYDLVISTSSCVAKGLVPPPLGKHVCYLHSPMRYAWDQEHVYFPHKPTLLRPWEIMRRLILSYLRLWDVASAVRIDHLIANSLFVARRVALFYGRQAHVIYPPVRVESFLHTAAASEGSEKSNSVRKVLLFGAWVPYKKMLQTMEFLIDQGIEVIAAGQGADIERAYKRYADKATFFLSPSDELLPAIFGQAHVLLFPAIEDFGIVPLEATASGLWVVAPCAGGTKETVVDGVTGFTFEPHDFKDMLRAVKHALRTPREDTDRQRMKDHVAGFCPERFDKEFLDYLHSVGLGGVRPNNAKNPNQGLNF